VDLLLERRLVTGYG